MEDTLPVYFLTRKVALVDPRILLNESWEIFEYTNRNWYPHSKFEDIRRYFLLRHCHQFTGFVTVYPNFANLKDEQIYSWIIQLPKNKPSTQRMKDTSYKFLSIIPTYN